MNVRRGFEGVFPIDYLPQIEPGKTYIVNTSPSTIAYGHWVAICNMNFFCSYGINPVVYGLPEMPYNDVCLQSVLSDVCGYYVILYARLISRGHGENDMLKCFTDDYKLNDRILMGFFSSQKSLVKWKSGNDEVCQPDSLFDTSFLY